VSEKGRGAGRSLEEASSVFGRFGASKPRLSGFTLFGGPSLLDRLETPERRNSFFRRSFFL